MNDFSNYLALKCADGLDASDLIRVAENAAGNNVRVLSACADSVPRLWSWLESHPVQIFTRFDYANSSGLAQEINSSFKRGSAGAQVFVSLLKLPEFVSEFLSVRNDLFFNKKLFIGLDLAEIQPSDWPDVFSWLTQIAADGMVLKGQGAKGKGRQNSKKLKSGNMHPYIVGQIYGFLESLGDWGGEIHFDISDARQNENAYRLIEKICPDLLDSVRFFVTKIE